MNYTKDEIIVYPINNPEPGREWCIIEPDGGVFVGTQHKCIAKEIFGKFSPQEIEELIKLMSQEGHPTSTQQGATNDNP
jgi:hypothetical protein